MLLIISLTASAEMVTGEGDGGTGEVPLAIGRDVSIRISVTKRKRVLFRDLTSNILLIC
jgi:hypothetical protein